METTAQREVDLRSKTVEHLGKAGYEVTPQSLNPNDQTVLEDLRNKFGDAIHIMGSEVEEQLNGKGPDTAVRLSPSKRLSQWVLNRAVRKQK